MSKNTFRFFRAGALDQLAIENENDLIAVKALDPKLWVAISMPAKGLEFDERTLALIDSDHDGRIRLPEIKKAVEFVCDNLSDFSHFFAGTAELPADSIKKESVLAGTVDYAHKCLTDTAVDKNSISLAQAEEAFANFAARPFNGDGILTPAAAEGNESVESLIKDMITATGGVVDASGATGITSEQVDAFMKSATDTIAWHENSIASADTIFPLGKEESAAAWNAISAVRAKVEDFFARTHLASFDPESAKKLNPTEDEVGALVTGEITGDASKAFPLARISVSEDVPTVPLVAGINPAWASEMAALRDLALIPALEVKADCSGMTETQWRKLLAQFSPYEAWFSGRPAGNIHALALDRIREISTMNPVEILSPLFERDKTEAPHREALENMERLCRYSRDLLQLLRNYVSFADFYALSENTVFIAGKLYIDRRACALSIRVDDVAAHSALAGKSNCYIVYCNCTRRSDGKTMAIASVFGDGDSDYLHVGRNGVFFDKKGDDWDATIVKIIEQPISIRQAFWSPYKKFARFVETQISNFAASKDKGVPQGSVPPTTPSAPKPAFDMAKYVGIFAAVGLAIGVIGAALAALGSAFMALAWWQMPLAILGVMLLISLPSMILAAIKLRHRTLGPILDANTWAINGCVKINVPLGKAYTEMPKKPAGSKTDGKDPFKPKGFPWGKFLFVCILIGAFSLLTLKYCPYVREKVGLEKKQDAPAQVETPKQESTPATPKSESQEDVPSAPESK